MKQLTVILSIFFAASSYAELGTCVGIDHKDILINDALCSSEDGKGYARGYYCYILQEQGKDKGFYYKYFVNEACEMELMKNNYKVKSVNNNEVKNVQFKQA